MTNSPTVDVVEAAARIAHEVNRAYCVLHSDHSQLPWDEAPEWQQESARNGVRLLINNPEATPEMSHESWLAEKLATGWKWGPTKDVFLKEHPCMLPYAELSGMQKGKDALFLASVHAALAALKL